MYEQLAPESLYEAERPGLERVASLGCKSNALTTTPPHMTVMYNYCILNCCMAAECDCVCK